MVHLQRSRPPLTSSRRREDVRGGTSSFFEFSGTQVRSQKECVGVGEKGEEG